MIVLLLVLVQLGALAAITFRQVEFGSRAGRWVYPYLGAIPIRNIAIGVALAAGACALVRLCLQRKWLERREVLTVFLAYVLGCAAEMLVRKLYPWSLGTIVSSGMANGFYSAALEVDARSLLASFGTSWASQHGHVVSNLPGKILFYKGLMLLSDSPQLLGQLVLLVSNLSAVLVYVLARQLFPDRGVAICAFVLTLFTPAKVFFQPILNVVSPVWILLSLSLFLAAVSARGRKKEWCLALALGLALYLAFVFEPLPFVLGLIFLALGVQCTVSRRLETHVPVRVVLGGLAGFLSGYIAFRVLFGFELYGAFSFVLGDAVSFNVRDGRPYSVWIFHNLKEYFLNAGAAGSAALMSYPLLARRHLAFANSGEVLVLSFLATLLLVDLLGVNRGEITRLWIFFTPVHQLALAFACRQGVLGRNAFDVVLSGCILQILFCIGTVGFVIP